MNFSQQPISEQRTCGFNALLEELRHLPQRRTYQLWHPTCLENHPFGIEIPSNEDDPSLDSLRSIRYIGYPGLTDSTKAAAGIVADILSFEGQRVTYLRVIYGEAIKTDSGKHTVYFEIGTQTKTYIVSGCTDYSGGGKSGSMYMQHIFACLSLLYGIEEILIHHVPFNQSEQINQALRNAVDHRDD